MADKEKKALEDREQPQDSGNGQNRKPPPPPDGTPLIIVRRGF